jgi:hypothetical protein
MDKKELVSQYKSRVQTGGVYAIKNTRLNTWLVEAAPDIKSVQNRFSFFGSTSMKAERDYKAQNGKDFVFEILEELTKGETQSEKEFADDLTALKAMRLEKIKGQELY